MFVKYDDLKNIDTTQFDWSEDEIIDFKAKVNEYKSYHDKPINQDNFYAAFLLCYNLVGRIPLPMYYLDVTYIIRSRANLETEIFSKENEISYRTINTSSILVGRFNRPQESMFYATVASENDTKSNPFITSCLEACKEILDENNTKPFQYFTTGYWHLNEPFYVFNLCFNEKFIDENPKFKEYTTKYTAEIRTLFKRKVADFIIDFWYFLSDLAGKKSESESDHFLTTIFWCAVKSYLTTIYKIEANGIAFTSSMTENSGVNLVLTPKAVDKYLCLKSSLMFKFTRNPNNYKTYRVDQCSDECIVREKRFALTKRF